MVYVSCYPLEETACSLLIAPFLCLQALVQFVIVIRHILPLISYPAGFECCFMHFVYSYVVFVLSYLCVLTSEPCNFSVTFLL
eukprot:m.34346 g.34346  ORF g.34346 m.34346 type:complete len:83 (-) comp9758_c0_seq2:38-286(-)